MAAPTKPGTLVLVRHGQSEWNKAGKFTGWVDVDLTPQGVKEATEGGKLLRDSGIKFDIMFASYLKRAIKTGNLMLNIMDQHWIPVKKTWRLNERMYGGLQGLDKKETVKLKGAAQVKIWRRSFDVPPPEIEEKSEYDPRQEDRYKAIGDLCPKTECLKDVIERVLPFWESDVEAALKAGKNVLVAAHGNSIRAICKHLDKIGEDVIPGLEIPTGVPLVYNFDDKMKPVKSDKAVAPLNGHFLGNADDIAKAQAEVANQTKVEA